MKKRIVKDFFKDFDERLEFCKKLLNKAGERSDRETTELIEHTSFKPASDNSGYVMYICCSGARRR